MFWTVGKLSEDLVSKKNSSTNAKIWENLGAKLKLSAFVIFSVRKLQHSSPPTLLSHDAANVRLVVV